MLFLSTRGLKIKKITKIEQKWLLLFIFSASFFMVFLAQKLIYIRRRSSIKLNYSRSLSKKMT